jgi:hypothetical protein
MTSKERVVNAFRHREPDRVPLFEIEINSPQASELLGREALTGYGGWAMAKQRAELLMRGQRDEYVFRGVQDSLELWHKLGLDMLKVRPNLPRNAFPPKVVEENAWLYADEKLKSWTLVAYSPETDSWFEKDSNIRQGGLPEFARYVQALEQMEPSVDDSEFDALAYALSDTRGKGLFLLGWVRLPLPLLSSWSQVLMEAMCLEPLLVKRYANAEAKLMMLYLRRQLEMGVDGVIESVDLCGNHGPLISPDHYKSFVEPYLQMYVNECHRHGVPFIKHTDGNLGALEKHLLVDSGIDGYHPIDPKAGMDLERVKQEYGAKITLIGNLDCVELLVHGSRAQIIQATIEAISKAAQGGGYILSSSNAIHSGVPTDSFLTMLEAAKRFGVYSRPKNEASEIIG